MIEEAEDFIPHGCCYRPPSASSSAMPSATRRRYRKCLEQANDDLRDQLQNNSAQRNQSPQAALEQQRRVINDIHKRIVAVHKRPRKTHLVNPTKSMAGSHRSGRSPRYSLRNSASANRRQAKLICNVEIAQNHFEPSQSARAQSSISKARSGCHQRCTSPHPPRSVEIQPLSARGVLRIV